MKTLSEIRGKLFKPTEIPKGSISTIGRADFKNLPITTGRTSGALDKRRDRITVGRKSPDASIVIPDTGDANSNTSIYQSEEIINESVEMDPPTVLILKRKYIRQVPSHNGGKPIRIALYYNEKLGRLFSIPYYPTGNISPHEDQLINSDIEKF